MRLALQLSCYNGGRYLPFLFASLKAQTKTDWHLFVLDNASDTDNKLLIEQAVANAGIPVSLKRVEKNIGFAGAHNLLFSEFTHNYAVIQLLNDDAILEPSFLEKCFAYLKIHPECAAVSGAVYRWNFDARDMVDGGKTAIVDTLGLDLKVTGAVKDRDAAQNKAQVHIPAEPYPVFGVSGCLPMYRVSAIKAASPDESLFDKSYTSYKEDVDLAHRFNARGYTAAIVPGAIAYHRRSLGLQANVMTAVQKTGTENDFLSYRNHLWTLLKNTRLTSLFTQQIGVLPYELFKAGYWMVRSPQVLRRTFADTRRAWPALMAWRRYTLKHKQPKRLRLENISHMSTPTKPQVDIAIVIVSHNDLAEACLTSLQAARTQTRHSTAVVVVDNASKTYRANEFVQPYIPDAWILLRDGDHGYGRSMNRGAVHVNAKYYFILNPDTALPDPDMFNKLIDYMTNHSGVGLVGPRVQGFAGDLHETCRRFPAWYMPFIQRTPLKDKPIGQRYLHTFLMRDYDHSDAKAVDWVQGSAMFVDGDLWHQLKGFDDRFWLYFEDTDLCRRVWLAGMQVMYLPSVTISHLHTRQSAKIKNIFLNLVKTKESRGHLISWLKYMLKWLGKKTPTHS